MKKWASVGAGLALATGSTAPQAAVQATGRPPLASVSHIAVFAKDPAKSERF